VKIYSSDPCADRIYDVEPMHEKGEVAKLIQKFTIRSSAGSLVEHLCAFEFFAEVFTALKLFKKCACRIFIIKKCVFFVAGIGNEVGCLSQSKAAANIIIDKY
jgi:hypothetical protein